MTIKVIPGSDPKQLLLRLMIKRQLNQREVSEILKTSPQTVSRWMTNKSKISNVYRKLIENATKSA